MAQLATGMSLAHLTELGLPRAQIASPIVIGNSRCETKAATSSAPTVSDNSAVREMKAANALDPSLASQLTKGGQAGRTKPLWLEDTYCFKGQALLQSVACGKENHLLLAFDQTIFHPQGGGQPTDVGEITADGLPALKVCMVSMDKETGTVYHECSGDSLDSWAKASAGTAVNLTVEEAARRINARVHSAGHLIDAAVAKAGFQWVPGKGYHFSDGAYVEYIMTAEQKAAVNKDTAQTAINDALQSLLANPTPVNVYLQDGVRKVEIEKTCGPCGGTHVKNTAELGSVAVKALKAKGTNMRVSYTVASAA